MINKTKKQLQEEINFLNRQNSIERRVNNELIHAITHIFVSSKKSLITGKKYFYVDDFLQKIAEMNLNREIRLFVNHLQEENRKGDKEE